MWLFDLFHVFAQQLDGKDGSRTPRHNSAVATNSLHMDRNPERGLEELIFLLFISLLHVTSNDL